MYLLFPQSGFGFSDTELNRVESEEGEGASSKAWGVDLGFSLKRNLEINPRLQGAAEGSIWSPDTEASFLDPSVLYYALGLRLNYPLKNSASFFNHIGLRGHTVESVLSHTTVFLTGSFDSPFKGHKFYLKDYNFSDYFFYALGDLIAGATSRIYKSDKLLSYFDVSVILFPLSRFSKEASLITTLGSTVRFLRQIQKKELWSLSFVSSHNFAYSQYKYASTDKTGRDWNIPLDTSHSIGFLLGQSYNQFMPSRARFYLTYYMGLDAMYNHNHFLTLGHSFSWKIRNTFRLMFSVHWRDNIAFYNLSDKNVRKKLQSDGT